MGYATRYEVEQALANALSKGSPDSGGPVPITQLGHTLTSTVTDDEIAQYIRWADEQVDGAISSIYRIPLRRVNKGTFRLAMDAEIGDTTLRLQDASRFTEGDVIIIRQGAAHEEHLVVACSQTGNPPSNFQPPPDTRSLCIWLPLANAYDANLARLEKVRYPDPVPKISANIAASFLYDRHFAAQVEGNKSEFGKALRAEAKQLLNLILSGATKLLVADANDFVGRRYYNHALDDVTGTKAEPGKNWLTEQ